jgi:predicted PurR-regulated permease PerM
VADARVPDEQRSVLRFTPSSAAALALALLAAMVLRNAMTAAHRIIGWGVASIVVAVLLKTPVDRLARYVPRVVALLVAGIGIAAVAGVLVYGVFDDLQSESRTLRRVGPQAAASLEQRDDRIGRVAQDLRLEERASDAFEALEVRFGIRTEVLAEAAGTLPTYFVCFILTIFLVIYGPRIVEGGLDQVRDPQRRERLDRMVHVGVDRGRSYLWWALGQGWLVGLATFGLATVTDLPAPTLLGLFAGVAATVPYIGIVVGSLPAVMLTAGLESPFRGGVVLAVWVLAQVVETLVLRPWIDRRTLHVGPAIPVIVAAIGIEVYGIGGALYGAALVVLGLAMADAGAATDEPLPMPMEDWADPGTPPPITTE